jgi:hypothetical protein
MVPGTSSLMLHARLRCCSSIHSEWDLTPWALPRARRLATSVSWQRADNRNSVGRAESGSGPPFLLTRSALLRTGGGWWEIERLPFSVFVLHCCSPVVCSDGSVVRVTGGDTEQTQDEHAFCSQLR